MNILGELWYRNLSPKKHMRQSGTHQELTNLIDRNQSELSTMLNVGEKDTLEKLLACQEGLSQVTEQKAVLAGFHMGCGSSWTTLLLCFLFLQFDILYLLGKT